MNHSFHTCLAKIVVITIYLVKDKTVQISSKMGYKYHLLITYNLLETLSIWPSCASLPNFFTFKDLRDSYNQKLNIARTKSKLIDKTVLV